MFFQVGDLQVDMTVATPRPKLNRAVRFILDKFLFLLCWSLIKESCQYRLIYHWSNRLLLKCGLRYWRRWGLFQWFLLVIFLMAFILIGCSSNIVNSHGHFRQLDVLLTHVYSMRNIHPSFLFCFFCLFWSGKPFYLVCRTEVIRYLSGRLSQIQISPKTT